MNPAMTVEGSEAQHYMPLNPAHPRAGGEPANMSAQSALDTGVLDPRSSVCKQTRDGDERYEKRLGMGSSGRRHFYPPG